MSAPWPIDFGALSIGSRVGADEIEKFCGHLRTVPAYRIAGQLRLVEMVRKSRPDLDPYVRTQGDDVIIMTDAEAAEHQDKQGQQALRRFISTHSRNMQVDATKLDESGQAKHERALYRHGRYATALGTVRKELRLEAVKSQKPLLQDDK